MSGSTWRPGYRACATSTRCWTLPCCRSTSTSPCSPPWGPPGLPPQPTRLRRPPLQLSLLLPLPASPALRPPPHPQKPPHQPWNRKSLQLLSHRAPRSCPRMGSLMQRSSAAVAYRSWSPRLPTDTAPVLAPAPTLEQPSAGTHPATKCQLPLSAPRSSDPQF